MPAKFPVFNRNRNRPRDLFVPSSLAAATASLLLLPLATVSCAIVILCSRPVAVRLFPPLLVSAAANGVANSRANTSTFLHGNDNNIRNCILEL